MGDLSAADVLAMTRENGSGSSFLEGNGIIILILFFLMLGGGFGGFGNNANAQGTFTRAEMQDGFNNQNLVNSFNGLNTALNGSFADLNLNMSNGFNGVQMGLNNGFNSVNSNLANLGYQMQQCCCQTKQEIQLQGDLTRQLINNNTMQNLRDVISDKNRQISEANFDASQATQTAQLEAFILANKSTTTTTA